MRISDNPLLMREIIMDHYNDPINKKVPENVSEYKQIRMDSTSCIDDITIYVKEKNNVVEDCKFDGVACTICTSSTDIMCDLVKGKTKDEIEEIAHNYFNMIYEKEYDEDLIEEAVVFKNTYKQASRIKCATLGWNGLKAILFGEENEEK
ncbi:MAG: SUF system NifU family Fe-S cluster assembly protein [Bacilli bacterium]|nr:SUF system NifU family Fe-S cluster assembly protein [Bacilli bacterium]